MKEIAAALLRRGDELLMVKQDAPAGPAWTVPAGGVEPGEEPIAALVREVREEAGLTVLDPGAVAFVVEVDDRRDRWSAIVWTWDVAAWEGAVDPDDDEILDIAWVQVEEAIDRLDGLSWHTLTARSLRGEIGPGSRWRMVVRDDGAVEIAPLS